MAKLGQLSAATNGQRITVVAVATLGTLLHTAVAGVTQFDRIFLNVMNIHTAAVQLTVEFGNVTPATNIILTIPANSGLFVVLNKDLLQNGLLITAFASVTSVLSIGGYIIRSDAIETV